MQFGTRKTKGLNWQSSTVCLWNMCAHYSWQNASHDDCNYPQSVFTLDRGVPPPSRVFTVPWIRFSHQWASSLWETPGSGPDTVCVQSQTLVTQPSTPTSFSNQLVLFIRGNAGEKEKLMESLIPTQIRTSPAALHQDCLCYWQSKEGESNVSSIRPSVDVVNVTWKRRELLTSVWVCGCIYSRCKNGSYQKLGCQAIIQDGCRHMCPSILQTG